MCDITKVHDITLERLLQRKCSSNPDRAVLPTTGCHSNLLHTYRGEACNKYCCRMPIRSTHFSVDDQSTKRREPWCIGNVDDTCKRCLWLLISSVPPEQYRDCRDGPSSFNRTRSIISSLASVEVVQETCSDDEAEILTTSSIVPFATCCISIGLLSSSEILYPI